MVNPFPPLSAEQFAQLRDSIKRYGVLVPVIVDQHGDVIDGRNRKQIADELHVKCPEQVQEFADDFARLACAMTANWHRRQLTKRQRDALVTRMRVEYKWSDRRIAQVLGVSQPTVSRTKPGDTDESPGTERTGRDGRHYPSGRATKEEVQARREASAWLWREGYGRDDIAEALGIGHSTVSADVAVMGIDTSIPRTIRPGPAPIIPWRKGQPRISRTPKSKQAVKPQRATPAEPAYRRSYVIDMIAMTEANLRADNVENRLAWDATEAAQAHDDAWFAQARAALGALIARVEVLQRVLDDPVERERRRSSMNETGERPNLRIA